MTRATECQIEHIRHLRHKNAHILRDRVHAMTGSERPAITGEAAAKRAAQRDAMTCALDGITWNRAIEIIELVR